MDMPSPAAAARVHSCGERPREGIAPNESAARWRGAARLTLLMVGNAFPAIGFGQVELLALCPASATPCITATKRLDALSRVAATAHLGPVQVSASHSTPLRHSAPTVGCERLRFWRERARALNSEWLWSRPRS